MELCCRIRKTSKRKRFTLGDKVDAAAYQVPQFKN